MPSTVSNLKKQKIQKLSMLKLNVKIKGNNFKGNPLKNCSYFYYYAPQKQDFTVK